MSFSVKNIYMNPIMFNIQKAHKKFYFVAITGLNISVNFKHSVFLEILTEAATAIDFNNLAADVSRSGGEKINHLSDFISFA